MPDIKITRFGYEYTLVMTDREDACFMGHKGYALHGIKKIRRKKLAKTNILP